MKTSQLCKQVALSVHYPIEPFYFPSKLMDFHSFPTRAIIEVQACYTFFEFAPEGYAKEEDMRAFFYLCYLYLKDEGK